MSDIFNEIDISKIITKAIMKEKPARLCANKDMHLGRASNMVWREGDLRPINEQKSINTV